MSLISYVLRFGANHLLLFQNLTEQLKNVRLYFNIMALLNQDVKYDDTLNTSVGTIVVTSAWSRSLL